MNEAELAERFNAELDGVFQGGKQGPFSPDPGAMALAAALARADFSGGTMIKESLRARLFPPPMRAADARAAGETGGYAARGGFMEAVRGISRKVYARPALAVACLLLAIFPLARRSGGPGVSPASPASLTAARAVPPAGAAARKSGAPVPLGRVAAGAADPGIFQSIPMARLEGEPIRDFFIESAGKGIPVILTAGREVRLENGSGIVWETEYAVFTYERRVISPDELFQRKSI